MEGQRVEHVGLPNEPQDIPEVEDPWTDAPQGGLYDIHYMSFLSPQRVQIRYQFGQVGELHRAAERWAKLAQEAQRQPMRSVIVHPYGDVVSEARVPPGVEDPRLVEREERTPHPRYLGEPQTHPTPALLRRGCLAALSIIVASIPVLLVGVAVMLPILYFGLTTFFLANYAAARAGEPNLIVRPATAVVGTLAFFGLTLTALVTALF